MSDSYYLIGDSNGNIYTQKTTGGSTPGINTNLWNGQRYRGYYPASTGTEMRYNMSAEYEMVPITVGHTYLIILQGTDVNYDWAFALGGVNMPVDSASYTVMRKLRNTTSVTQSDLPILFTMTAQSGEQYIHLMSSWDQSGTGTILLECYDITDNLWDGELYIGYYPNANALTFGTYSTSKYSMVSITPGHQYYVKIYGQAERSRVRILGSNATMPLTSASISALRYLSDVESNSPTMPIEFTYTAKTGDVYLLFYGTGYLSDEYIMYVFDLTSDYIYERVNEATPQNLTAQTFTTHGFKDRPNTQKILENIPTVSSFYSWDNDELSTASFTYDAVPIPQDISTTIDFTPDPIIGIENMSAIYSTGTNGSVKVSYSYDGTTYTSPVDIAQFLVMSKTTLYNGIIDYLYLKFLIEKDASLTSFTMTFTRRPFTP